jgi:hypothetical protein
MTERPEQALIEAWRQRMYPHIDAETFYRYVAVAVGKEDEQARIRELEEALDLFVSTHGEHICNGTCALCKKGFAALSKGRQAR